MEVAFVAGIEPGEDQKRLPNLTEELAPIKAPASPIKAPALSDTLATGQGFRL
jgi:hypothetical protein